MKKIEKNLRFSRREYAHERLGKETTPENPTELLKAWLGEAVKSDITDSNAMFLSTVGLLRNHKNKLLVIL